MISKLRLFIFSLLAVAIFSCGGDNSASEGETVGKNSNVAPGLASSSDTGSSDNRDNIFRLNFSDPPTFDPALVTDSTSLIYLEGSKIMWDDDLNGSAFTIDNPNATSSCGCGTSFSVN